MIHYEFKKWIYISLENPFKTMKQLKGVFKPLKRYFKWSFDEWNYYPVLWCSRPSKIQIMTHDVMWKDKYDTPRYEVPPYIWIHIYKLNFVWFWNLSPNFYLENPNNSVDDYWEQALWYLFYADKSIEKAKETWPIIWSETELSTWTDKYLSK